MFCPKCGSQNDDNSAFCRKCGANLSGVMAVAEGRIPEYLSPAEQSNDLFSTGIRNLILGFGAALIAFLLLFNLREYPVFWLAALAAGIFLLASGITRIVKSGEKKINTARPHFEPNSLPTAPPKRELPPVQTEYIPPANQTYQQDKVMSKPPSVTEPTTRHLQIDPEAEPTQKLSKE